MPGWLEGAEKALKLGGGEFYAGNQEFFFKSNFIDNFGSSFFSIVEDRKVYKTSLNIKILVFF